MKKTKNITPAKAVEAPRIVAPLIAHARNDITIPHFTGVFQYTDDTLISRGGQQGLKIYDDIERDPYAHAVLAKRKLALVGREWRIEPASEARADRKAAEIVEQVLGRIPFDQLCLDLLDATLKGFSVAEIVWAERGGHIVPQRIVAHDPRRFTFDEAWEPRLLTMTHPMLGEQLPKNKFIVHRCGVKGNNPFGLGLGSKLFWPVLFKREGIAFWMVFLEKYASPTPVGKYPEGTLPQDQKRLVDALQAMVQSGAIVVPIGTDVSFLEATLWHDELC
jgi:phage gp29-like protein